MVVVRGGGDSGAPRLSLQRKGRKRALIQKRNHAVRTDSPQRRQRLTERPRRTGPQRWPPRWPRLQGTRDNNARQQQRAWGGTHQQVPKWCAAGSVPSHQFLVLLDNACQLTSISLCVALSQVAPSAGRTRRADDADIKWHSGGGAAGAAAEERRGSGWGLRRIEMKSGYRGDTPRRLAASAGSCVGRAGPAGAAAAAVRGRAGPAGLAPRAQCVLRRAPPSERTLRVAARRGARRDDGSGQARVSTHGRSVFW